MGVLLLSICKLHETPGCFLFTVFQCVLLVLFAFMLECGFWSQRPDVFKLQLIDLTMWDRLYVKHFTYVTLFNFHNNP